VAKLLEIGEHEDVLKASYPDSNVPSPVQTLSKREHDVLALASRGMTNGQIAHQLALSIHGVKFHLGSIFRKLGVDNRTAATALYLSELNPVVESRDFVE
jgi:DNA-binding CsgD family transcriptional regulator